MFIVTEYAALKAENEAWFYSKVTIILRHYLSIDAKDII